MVNATLLRSLCWTLFTSSTTWVDNTACDLSRMSATSPSRSSQPARSRHWTTCCVGTRAKQDLSCIAFPNFPKALQEPYARHASKSLRKTSIAAVATSGPTPSIFDKLMEYVASNRKLLRNLQLQRVTAKRPRCAR